MSFEKYFDGKIEEKLLDLNTAYIGKVLSYSKGKANIQPLAMIKEYGKNPQKKKPIPNVPVIRSARYKGEITTATIEDETITYLKPVSLAAGDIVLCVCCDRDITETKKGNVSTPSVGHHSMSDSVVVGIL